jgi:hypothetical protein
VQIRDGFDLADRLKQLPCLQKPACLCSIYTILEALIGSLKVLKLFAFLMLLQRHILGHVPASFCAENSWFEVEFRKRTRYSSKCVCAVLLMEQGSQGDNINVLSTIDCLNLFTCVSHHIVIFKSHILKLGSMFYWLIIMLLFIVLAIWGKRDSKETRLTSALALLTSALPCAVGELDPQSSHR